MVVLALCDMGDGLSDNQPEEVESEGADDDDPMRDASVVLRVTPVSNSMHLLSSRLQTCVCFVSTPHVPTQGAWIAGKTRRMEPCTANNTNADAAMVATGRSVMLYRVLSLLLTVFCTGRFCRDNVPGWSKMTSEERRKWVVANKGQGGRGRRRQLKQVQSATRRQELTVRIVKPSYIRPAF